MTEGSFIAGSLRIEGHNYGVRHRNFSSGNAPPFGSSAFKRLVRRLLLRRDRLWGQGVGGAQSLRESARELLPSIRQPRRSQEGLGHTPHRNLGPFRRQQGIACASLLHLEPGLLDRTIRRIECERSPLERLVRRLFAGLLFQQPATAPRSCPLTSRHHNPIRHSTRH